MTTAVQVQFRRGTQSQMAAFTGAAGEMNVDTTNNRVVVQDGTTAGGWPAARLSEIAGGFLNKFRNGAMDVWQRGTSGLTATTSGAYTADGWIVLPTGGSVTAAQAGGRLTTKSSLQVTGASAVTDVIVKQRIESLIAAAFCSQAVTVQAQIYNDTGGTVTPALTVNRPSAQDNYASVTADVTAASLQPCPTGAWTRVGYTFQANAASYNGLEIVFDFGNNFGSSGKSLQITECDIRVTNGVPTGLNVNPPAPELRPVWSELAFCQRYLEKSFRPAVAPAQAAGFSGALRQSAFIAGANGYHTPTICFLVLKTSTATLSVTLYNPVNANAQAYNNSQAADCSSTVAVNAFENGFQINWNNPSSTQVNDALFIHWLASAEL